MHGLRKALELSPIARLMTSSEYLQTADDSCSAV